VDIGIPPPDREHDDMAAAIHSQPRQSKPELKNKLTIEELRLVMRNLKPNMALMPIFGVIISAMLARWVSLPNILTWLAVVVAGAVPQAVISALFARSEPSPSEAHKWTILCAGSYALFASCWASMGYFLWVPHEIVNNMVIFLVLACTLAGSAAVSGASVPVGVTGFAIYGATLILLPLRDGTAVYQGISLLAVFYVAYMGHVSRSIHSTAHDMLRLRDDKNELIDALARAKTESDKARARAEAASLAKSQFLANMSHELRTPLNAILGFSEMIHTGNAGGDAPRHVEYAKIIHDSGYHLLALINDILDLAKIEAGGLKLHENLLDLRKLIAESVTLITAKAEAGGLTLTTRLAADLPDLHADQRALKQILLNLLSNAVKFTPPGGQITVFAHVEREGTLALGVRDSGLGIAKEDHARVFQHFGQGRHDVVTGDKGTGLGLPIVKGLVVAHRGTVELESAAGKGTCVTIHLPADRLRPRPELEAAG